MRPIIRKAERASVKASIMIEGLPGTGKTGLALLLAHSLVPNWDKIGMTDTENKSGDIYEGTVLNSGEKVGQFQKIDLTEDTGYAPMNYKACVDAFVKAGMEVVITDSLTHAWQRTGGVLDMVNQVEQKTKNKYTAWGDGEVVQNKNTLFELVRNNKVHVITTVRVKEKFGMEFDNTTGKNKVMTLGEQQQMQEGLKYEPDLVLKALIPGSKTSDPVVEVIKSRYPMFEKDEIYTLTPELIASIRKFLSEGVDPEELIKQQKLEYINGIVAYCQGNQARKAVWDNLKNQSGYGEHKIGDIPMEVIKKLYIALTN